MVVVDNWKNSGEIYDLDHKSLDYLTPDIQLYKSYQGTATEAEAEAEDQEPTLVVFFNLHKGSMLILNASTGIAHEHSDPSFAFLAVRYPLPLDLEDEDCESTHPLPLGLEDEDYESTIPLTYAVTNSRAVFHKRTFYWFTHGLKLYGYDIDGRRWMRSECLERKFRPLRTMAPYEKPQNPLLLGLPNGKFLAIVYHKPGEFTMASLCARKDVVNLTLHVKVEHVQYFHPRDPRFTPRAGKARHE